MTPASRLAAVACALVVAAALSACSSPTPTATGASPSATASSSAVASPAASGGLSFADGNILSSDISKAPTFLNGFVSPTSGWTTSDKSDTANGLYVYTSADGLCTAQLSQLRADGTSFAIVKGDDQASSINALEWYFSSTPTIAEQAKASSTDATLPYGANWEVGAPGTDFRGVSASTTNGGAFATYARAFGVPGVVLIAQISCTTVEAFAQHAQNALLDSGVIVAG